MKTTKEIKAVIAGLTEHQREVLGLIGMNQDRGHMPSTLKKLVSLGLIEEKLVQKPFALGMSMTVKTYSVPTPVHTAWCEYCSEVVAAEDAGEMEKQ